jgi:hypothetical protein
MVALCLEHHKKADGGAYTDNQLRKFKEAGAVDLVTARFDWMRRELLAVVGGNYYLRCPEILRVNGVPVIWFNRGPDQELLLNFNMVTRDGEQGPRVEDNVWTVVPGDGDRVECPATGNKIHIVRRNGDELSIEFGRIKDRAELDIKHPRASSLIDHFGAEWPLTVLRVWETTGDGRLNLGKMATHFMTSSFTGSSAADVPVGFAVKIPPPLSPEIRQAIKKTVAKQKTWTKNLHTAE